MAARRAYPLAVFVISLSGCGNEFAPPSEIHGLRVLAVRADPASGEPGASVRLEMLRADRALGPEEAPRAVQVAWLGGCHAPPTRQFFACYPLLGQIASQLSPRVSETPTEGRPPGFFGMGERFEFQVPNDVLERSPRVETDPIHFAPSYVFFAACAGELVPRPDLTDRVPLGCVSPQTGEPLGSADFVTGFATLFTFEGAKNDNPVIESLRFGGADLPSGECVEDADCTPAGELEVACSSAGRCAVVIEPCAGEDCPRYSIEPQVGQASAETLPNENRPEILWANYYANAGGINVASQLVNDRATGWVSDYSARFRPPRVPVEATIWVTVNDQRGGAAWVSFDVLVRGKEQAEP